MKCFKYVNQAKRRIGKYTFCAHCTGKGNDFKLIPMVQMESQHSTGVPTCHQGCSGAGTRGNAVPIDILCGNAVPIDIFVSVGTAFPLPEFVF